MRNGSVLRLVVAALAALVLYVPAASWAQAVPAPTGNAPVAASPAPRRASALEALIERIRAGDASALMEMRGRLRRGDVPLLRDLIGAIIGQGDVLVELVDAVLGLLTDTNVRVALDPVMDSDLAASVHVMADIRSELRGLSDEGLLTAILSDSGLADLIADLIGIDVRDVLLLIQDILRGLV